MKLSPLQIMWHANDDHGRLLIHITSWNELVTIEWAFKNGLIINWSNNSWFVAHGSRLMTKGKGMGATKKLAGWLLEAGGGDERWRWKGAMANRRRWCGGGRWQAAEWNDWYTWQAAGGRAARGRPNLVDCSGLMRAKYFTTFWYLQNRGK